MDFQGGMIVLIVFVSLFAIWLLFYFIPVGLWFSALVSGVRISLLQLVLMRWRKVPPSTIVSSMIESTKAGLALNPNELEAHYLAGGNVTNVVHALVSAQKANIMLDFKMATAIDLAGRDVFEAVQMSVNPKVINTPPVAAVAKDGIQLIAKARVTVRANIKQLVGGAGEETVLARVGEGIVSSIGSALSHKIVLENPARTIVAFKANTAWNMADMLCNAVNSGTGSEARLTGMPVGGKTGTSEKLDEYDEDGNQVKDKIVSFIGVAPIDDPQYAVLVALDTPAYSQNSEKYTVHGMYISGGLMAAPTVRDIFLDILPYLGVEPDYDSEDIRGVNFTVPDVIGMDEAEAGTLLAEKTITYRIVGTGSTVTDQLPAPGSQVPGNSQIILYMGAEKQQTTVEVPDFIGCSVADVNYLAANAGLYVQAKGTDRTDVYVLAAYQDIEPGTEVDRGTTITVEFSSTGASD